MARTKFRWYAQSESGEFAYRATVPAIVRWARDEAADSGKRVHVYHEQRFAGDLSEGMIWVQVQDAALAAEVNGTRSPVEWAPRGTTGVLIHDSHHPESSLDPAGGRWVVICTEHSQYVNVTSLATARAVAQDVHGEFCEGGEG